jgi:hypothetical protein
MPTVATAKRTILLVGATHSLDKGLIYVEELPMFFASRRNNLQYRGPDHRNYSWSWEDVEVIYLESGFFSASDRVTVQLRSGQKLESAAVQGLVAMVSLEGQRNEHRLSNLALIAPSPIRSTAKPVGLAARR